MRRRLRAGADAGGTGVADGVRGRRGGFGRRGLRGGPAVRWGATAVVLLLVLGGVSRAAAPRPGAQPTDAVSPARVRESVAPGASLDVAKTVSTPVVPPRPEVVLLVDGTGSIDDAISRIRDQLTEITSAVTDQQPDARFAVATFGDSRAPDDPYYFEVRQPLTDDVGKVQYAVNHLPTDLGGYSNGPAEDWINALYQIAGGAGGGTVFRPGATPIVVLVSDASSHPATDGHTLDDAIGALNAKGARVLGVEVKTPLGDGLDGNGVNNDNCDTTADPERCDEPHEPGQGTKAATGTQGAIFSGLDSDQVVDAVVGGLTNLPTTVSYETLSCDPGLTVTLDSPSRTVTSGQPAGFTETIQVADDAPQGSVLRCALQFLLDGSVPDRQSLGSAVRAAARTRAAGPAARPAGTRLTGYAVRPPPSVARAGLIGGLLGGLMGGADGTDGGAATAGDGGTAGSAGGGGTAGGADGGATDGGTDGGADGTAGSSGGATGDDGTSGDTPGGGAGAAATEGDTADGGTGADQGATGGGDGTDEPVPPYQELIDITVSDVTAPVVTVDDRTVVATGKDGARVEYTATAEDGVDGDLPVTCDPPSGAVFPTGVTTVTCTATDAAGNTGSGSATFEVLPPPVPDEADLAVSATLSPTRTYVGKRATARFTLTNAGPRTARDVVLATTWPTVEGAGKRSLSRQSACTEAHPCTLAPGKRLTVTRSAVYRSAVSGPVQVSVSGAPRDPRADDNKDTVRLTVLRPKLTITPTVGPPGQTVLARGKDFPPGATVRLSWNPGITAARSTVRVGSDGTFEAQVLVLRKDRVGPRELTASVSGVPALRKPYLVVRRHLDPPDFAGRN